MFIGTREFILSSLFTLVFLTSCGGGSSGSGGGGIPTGNAQVHLTWSAPTENTDGSSYDNPAGFRIYYGTTQSSLDGLEEVNSPDSTEYYVENLEEGTDYIFVMTAVNSLGAESSYSNIVTKTAQ